MRVSDVRPPLPMGASLPAGPDRAVQRPDQAAGGAGRRQTVALAARVALAPLSTERATKASLVKDAVDSLWPARFGDGAPLQEDEPLGDGGLGLDSIEIVELVLACLSRAGLPASRADALLEAGPLTIGSLIDHLGHE